MTKDLAMRIFIGHLAAYVAVVAICAGLNLWLNPATLWWPWVLIGWGTAVATHAFALLLRKTRRRERIFIDPKARAFAVHLFAYAAVVLVLLYVNLAVTPKVLWFYWIALGWGLGVAFHGWCAMFKRRKPKAAESRSPPARRAEAKHEAEPQQLEKKPRRKRTPVKRKPKTGGD